MENPNADVVVAGVVPPEPAANAEDAPAENANAAPAENAAEPAENAAPAEPAENAAEAPAEPAENAAEAPAENAAAEPAENAAAEPAAANPAENEAPANAEEEVEAADVKESEAVADEKIEQEPNYDFLSGIGVVLQDLTNRKQFNDRRVTVLTHTCKKGKIAVHLPDTPIRIIVTPEQIKPSVALFYGSSTHLDNLFKKWGKKPEPSEKENTSAWDWNGKLEKEWAIKFLEEYLLVNGEQLKNVVNVGILWETYFNDVDRALELFDKAIELDPKELRAYRKKAELLKKLGKLKDAADVYEKMLESVPDRATKVTSAGYHQVCLNTIVRATEKMDSERVRILPVGSHVNVAIKKGRRVFIDEPVKGWCSSISAEGNQILRKLKSGEKLKTLEYLINIYETLEDYDKEQTFWDKQLELRADDILYTKSYITWLKEPKRK